MVRAACARGLAGALLLAVLAASAFAEEAPGSATPPSPESTEVAQDRLRLVLPGAWDVRREEGERGAVVATRPGEGQQEVWLHASSPRGEGSLASMATAAAARTEEGRTLVRANPAEPAERRTRSGLSYASQARITRGLSGQFRLALICLLDVGDAVQLVELRASAPDAFQQLGQDVGAALEQIAAVAPGTTTSSPPPEVASGAASGGSETPPREQPAEPSTEVEHDRLAFSLPGVWLLQRDTTNGIVIASPQGNSAIGVIVTRAADRGPAPLSSALDEALARLARGREPLATLWPAPREGVTRAGVPFAAQGAATRGTQGDERHACAFALATGGRVQTVILIAPTAAALQRLIATAGTALDGSDLRLPPVTPTPLAGERVPHRFLALALDRPAAWADVSPPLPLNVARFRAHVAVGGERWDAQPYILRLGAQAGLPAPPAGAAAWIRGQSGRAEDRYEPNQIKEHAPLLPAGFSANLTSADNDWFRLPPGQHTVELAALFELGDLELQIVDASGSVRASSATIENRETCTVTVGPNERVYVRVYRAFGDPAVAVPVDVTVRLDAGWPASPQLALRAFLTQEASSATGGEVERTWLNDGRYASGTFVETTFATRGAQAWCGYGAWLAGPGCAVLVGAGIGAEDLAALEDDDQRAEARRLFGQQVIPAIDGMAGSVRWDAIGIDRRDDLARRLAERGAFRHVHRDLEVLLRPFRPGRGPAQGGADATWELAADRTATIRTDDPAYGARAGEGGAPPSFDVWQDRDGATWLVLRRASGRTTFHHLAIEASGAIAIDGHDEAPATSAAASAPAASTEVAWDRLRFSIPGNWLLQPDASAGMIVVVPAGGGDSGFLLVRALDKGTKHPTVVLGEAIAAFERGRELVRTAWRSPQHGTTASGIPFSAQAVVSRDPQGRVRFGCYIVLAAGGMAQMFAVVTDARASIERILEPLVAGLDDAALVLPDLQRQALAGETRETTILHCTLTHPASWVPERQGSGDPRNELRFAVRVPWGPPQSYQLRVRSDGAPAAAPVATDRLEPNDRREQALPIGAGFTGTLTIHQDEDWFVLPPGRHVIEVAFEHDDGDIDIAIVDSRGISHELGATLNDRESVTVTVGSGAGGARYLRVWHEENWHTDPIYVAVDLQATVPPSAQGELRGFLMNLAKLELEAPDGIEPQRPWFRDGRYPSGVATEMTLVQQGQGGWLTKRYGVMLASGGYSLLIGAGIGNDGFRAMPEERRIAIARYYGERLIPEIDAVVASVRWDTARLARRPDLVQWLIQRRRFSYYYSNTESFSSGFGESSFISSSDSFTCAFFPDRTVEIEHDHSFSYNSYNTAPYSDYSPNYQWAGAFIDDEGGTGRSSFDVLAAGEATYLLVRRTNGRTELHSLEVGEGRFVIDGYSD